MIDSATLANRILGAEDYLAALERLRDVSWRDTYERYKLGALTIYESLSICHPRYYGESLDANSSQIRGPRAFTPEDLPKSAKCGSVHVWGYQCPLTLREPLHADHVFPYSYGGPTEARNKRYLCKDHNRIKGCDIHSFDWNDRLVWVPHLLYRISRYLAVS